MATRTLNEFISTIKTQGTARLNRFSVLISNPATSSYNDLVQLYCEQAALPSISFASQPTRTYGEQREVVYDRTFEALTLTFIVDRQYKVKEYFDAWIDKIVDPTTRNVGYYDQYVRNIKITTQDTKDSNTYETEIFEAYPKTIGAINLDHNSKDIVKLQVTFNYKFHVNKKLVSPDNDKNPKKLFGLDIPDPYKLTAQAGAYLRDTVSNSINVPDLYYDNFQQFQESITDRFSVSNAIERQGQTTGSGIPSDLSDFYG